MASNGTSSTIGGRQGRLRGEIPAWQALLCGLLMAACVLALWWYVTAGEAEQRIVSGAKLPSPAETFAKFKSLWFDQALTRNTWASLQRVSLGFALATAIGVPLGVACGCFPRVGAFFTPLLVFGRNVPMAAVIPLTILLFGIGEQQKVVFIFLAAVAFVISDAAQAIKDVPQKYIDTAYTLGASQWQVIRKVLFPLALPSILNSLRLLFSLAFGYIMLAEVIKVADDARGLGGVISNLQKRNLWEQIYLILLIIPVIAFALDRFLLWCQRELLPHRYERSSGLLATVWKWLADNAWSIWLWAQGIAGFIVNRFRRKHVEEEWEAQLAEPAPSTAEPTATSAEDSAAEGGEPADDEGGAGSDEGKPPRRLDGPQEPPA